VEFAADFGKTLFYNKHSMDPCSPIGPGDNLYKQNTGLLKLPGKIHVDSMYPRQPPIIQNGDLRADSLLPGVRLSMILSLAMVYLFGREPAEAEVDPQAFSQNGTLLLMLCNALVPKVIGQRGHPHCYHFPFSIRGAAHS
jgi:hypothetical protein